MWALSSSEPWGPASLGAIPVSLLRPGCCSQEHGPTCSPTPTCLRHLALRLPSSNTNIPITCFSENFLISPRCQKGLTFLFCALCLTGHAFLVFSKAPGLCNEPLSEPQLTAPSSAALLLHRQQIPPGGTPLTDAFTGQVSSSVCYHSRTSLETVSLGIFLFYEY